jgi:hypothetical protein
LHCSRLSHRIPLSGMGRDAPPYRFFVATFHLGLSTRTIMAEHRTTLRPTRYRSTVNTMLVGTYKTVFAPVIVGLHLISRTNWFTHAISSHVDNAAFWSLGQIRAPAPNVPLKTLGFARNAFARRTLALLPKSHFAACFSQAHCRHGTMRDCHKAHRCSGNSALSCIEDVRSTVFLPERSCGTL